MDNGFIFKTIFLLVIATATEAIFFDYPKKALTDFLHSLKDKKEAAKKSNEEIHHYHLHYYPVPVSLVFEEEYPVKVSPTKYELDHLHSEKLRILGWTNHEYKHVPRPGFILPVPKHRESWSNSHPIHESNGLTFQDQIDIAAIGREIEHHSHVEKKVTHQSVEHRHQSHISLHLRPFHQEIVVQPSPSVVPQKEEKPVHPFTAFFQKLRNIKNSLFSYNDDKKSSFSRGQCDDKIESPAGSAAYAIYFHPRNLYKL